MIFLFAHLYSFHDPTNRRKFYATGYFSKFIFTINLLPVLLAYKDTDFLIYKLQDYKLQESSTVNHLTTQMQKKLGGTRGTCPSHQYYYQCHRKGDSGGWSPPHNFGAQFNKVISHMNTYKIQKTYPWRPHLPKHLATPLIINPFIDTA